MGFNDMSVMHRALSKLYTLSRIKSKHYRTLSVSLIIIILVTIILLIGSILINFVSDQANTLLDTPDSNNSTLSINSVIINTNQQIEIGKNVTWTQTIILNSIIDVLSIEIPNDAEIIQITLESNELGISVINNDKISSQDQIDIFESNVSELILKNATNSTVMINGEKSALILLEEVTQIKDDTKTKLVIIYDVPETIEIEYETPAPYTTENESDTANFYEKIITVKSDSMIHYENVRSYSAIPEEYFIQGAIFELEWIINGTSVNIVYDERFVVQFEDTDNNCMPDQISWIVPQLSKKIFSINANTTNVDKTLIVKSINYCGIKLGDHKFNSQPLFTNN